MTRRHIRFFVSYAHRDGKQKTGLLERLDPFLSASRRYEYSLWDDGHICLGTNWREEIERALDACDFGMLFVSPSFLTSRFIKDVELPRFVGPRARRSVLPVALGRVLVDHMDLRGLEERQIFFHNGRCYARCATGKTRDDFAEGLFLAIEGRLTEFFGRGRRA